MKKIALVGGGSGGHIYPLLSYYESIEKNYPGEVSWVFFGEKGHLEEQECLQRGIPFISVVCHKFPRYFTWDWLKIPFYNTYGFFQSFFSLRREKVDCIFVKGSHVSPGVVIAAFFQGIPVFLHESDLQPGLANKINALFAKKVFVGTEGALEYFPKRTNPEWVGQILSSKMLQIPKKNIDLLPKKIPHLLFLGGSQGARSLFDFLLTQLDSLQDFKISVVLGTKNGEYREKFLGWGNVVLYDFLSQDEMVDLYHSGDLCVSRPGANSGAELLTAGIASLFVPMDASITNNHQEKNAQEFMKYGAWFSTEENLNQVFPLFLQDWRKIGQEIQEKYIPKNAAETIYAQMK